MALVRHVISNKIKLPNKLPICFYKSRLLHTTPRLHIEDEISFIKKNNTLTEEQKKKIEEEVKEKTGNWISHGFSYTDKDEDKYSFVFTNFTLVSLFGCTIIFLLIYMPKQKERDWSMREAYLELERRERLGLNLIDPNFVPVERIKLPSDEELGRFRIII